MKSKQGKTKSKVATKSRKQVTGKKGTQKKGKSRKSTNKNNSGGKSTNNDNKGVSSRSDLFFEKEDSETEYRHFEKFFLPKETMQETARKRALSENVLRNLAARLGIERISKEAIKINIFFIDELIRLFCEKLILVLRYQKTKTIMEPQFDVARSYVPVICDMVFVNETKQPIGLVTNNIILSSNSRKSGKSKKDNNPQNDQTNTTPVKNDQEQKEQIKVN